MVGPEVVRVVDSSRRSESFPVVVPHDASPAVRAITATTETTRTHQSYTEGTVYSVALKAKKGTAPYTFSVTSGTLPPGLTLSSSGLLSGSPTSSGTYDFTVGVTDDVGNTGVRITPS